MAKALSATVTNQITRKDIKISFTFTINGTDYSSYLLSNNISVDRKFGSSAAQFSLENTDGGFGNGGARQINVGDVIAFKEQFAGDSTVFNKFYGIVTQRTVSKTSNSRIITLACLDYISSLQFLDIDLEVEGTKIEVTEETLTPSYLPAPNESLAQLFSFANNSIATNPVPIIMIKDKIHTTYDPRFDGFEVRYDVGQIKLGTPLNALYNYDLIAKSYYFYTKGKYAEDILETILTLPDGYGNYLFGETSAQNVIDNHLTTTFNTEEGVSIDYLTPNVTSTDITIETTITSATAAGDTTIHLASTSGLPTSGTGTINGDTITWSGISGNDLTGVPATGTNAVLKHASGSYFKYSASYAAGKVWYLKYSNLITDLVSGNFTVPSSSSITYIDKRYGRIILNNAVSLSSVVTCNVDYTFKTLQASAIELNYISFRSREVGNRFEAISKLRNYLAPNYIIRTNGDSKIWSSYLRQKTTEDYTLNLVTDINYLEDEDLYTRVLFYGKNKNPTNIMFKDGVEFVTSTETYKALASQTNLIYSSEEGNYYVYTCGISNAGYIALGTITPLVYINGTVVDNKEKQMSMVPIVQEKTTITETTGGGMFKDPVTQNYYHYKLNFAHTSIQPSQPIYFYDANGNNVFSIGAYDVRMDYSKGIYYPEGDTQNTVIESISTASYFVFYSTSDISIDYDNVIFKISKNLLPIPEKANVSATFEYWTVMTNVFDINSVIDGRWDTQVQTEFFAEPPSGYNYAILDLGAVYNIQAVDILAGFYKPDQYRKFDIDMRLSLQYSLDNSTYYDISDKTNNFKLSGGESQSFEESDLGVNFSARYLKLIIENLKKIEYKNGVWVAAFTEISAFDDVIIKSEATLVLTTLTTSTTNSGASTVAVSSTKGFASSGTAYINEVAFTYTGITSTSFTGCSGIVSTHATGTRVTEALDSSTSIYDDNGLLQKMGDRVLKEIKVSDDTLYSQTQLDTLATSYLQEVIKNHNKLSVGALFCPYINVGHSVRLVDTSNGINDIYFVEAINCSGGKYTLTLAMYPS